MGKGITGILIIAAVLGSGGCGDSTGTGAHPAAQPPPPPATSEATNVPYQIASPNDLAIFGSHVHQDYYNNPTHLSFWWGVRSTFATDVVGVDWKLERLDGTPQPALTGTMGTIPANNAGDGGHAISVDWIEQQPGARHQYRLSINTARSPSEAGYDNDTYVFEVDVPTTTRPSQAGDLEFLGDEAHVHTMLPDSQYDVHFIARNRLASDIPATKWRVQDPLEGIDASYDLAAIAAGGTAEADHILVLMAPGLHAVTVTLDSAGQVSETDEDNNTRVFYLLVGSPAGSG